MKPPLPQLLRGYCRNGIENVPAADPQFAAAAMSSCEDSYRQQPRMRPVRSANYANSILRVGPCTIGLRRSITVCDMRPARPAFRRLPLPPNYRAAGGGVSCRRFAFRLASGIRQPAGHAASPAEPMSDRRQAGRDRYPCQASCDPRRRRLADGDQWLAAAGSGSHHHADLELRVSAAGIGPGLPYMERSDTPPGLPRQIRHARRICRQLGRRFWPSNRTGGRPANHAAAFSCISACVALHDWQPLQSLMMRQQRSHRRTCCASDVSNAPWREFDLVELRVSCKLRGRPPLGAGNSALET